MIDTLHMEMNEYLPLRDVVFQTLRQAILRGEISPGERLMEIHLAQKLGVSRTPVREAIRMLELEGLVTTVPRKGTVVAEITVSDLEDVLEVRQALEELAVRIVCKKITKEQLAEMKGLAARFRETLKGDDVVACAEADMKFHDAIYNATGNRRLIQILNNLREQMYRYRMEYLKDKSSHQILVKEHEEILQALQEQDEQKALAAISCHIDRQKEHIIAELSGKKAKNIKN
ncbi:MAG: GntR family transcriptional regulator [Lachnospiraceae bacterium]|nr:GntR family transcriptional regulator [Lachnospiraceae bacterium]